MSIGATAPSFFAASHFACSAAKNDQRVQCHVRVHHPNGLTIHLSTPTSLWTVTLYITLDDGCTWALAAVRGVAPGPSYLAELCLGHVLHFRHPRPARRRIAQHLTITRATSTIIHSQNVNVYNVVSVRVLVYLRLDIIACRRRQRSKAASKSRQ